MSAAVFDHAAARERRVKVAELNALIHARETNYSRAEAVYLETLQLVDAIADIDMGRLGIVRTLCQIQLDRLNGTIQDEAV